MNPHTRRLRRHRRLGRKKIHEIAVERRHARARNQASVLAKAARNAPKAEPTPSTPPATGGRLLAAMLSQAIKT